jgi:hypothetical protein
VLEESPAHFEWPVFNSRAWPILERKGECGFCEWPVLKRRVAELGQYQPPHPIGHDAVAVVFLIRVAFFVRSSGCAVLSIG